MIPYNQLSLADICRVKIISGIQPQRKQPLKELQEQQEQAERGNLPEDVSLLSELWREHSLFLDHSLKYTNIPFFPKSRFHAPLRKSLA